MLSEGLYGTHTHKKTAGTKGKLKTRIVFQKLANLNDSVQNSFRIYARQVSDKQRTKTHAPIIINPLTKYRFVPLRVKEGEQKSTWVLVNYGSLERMGISKAEAKAAFKNHDLEKLVRAKIVEIEKANKKSKPAKKQQPKAKPIAEGKPSKKAKPLGTTKFSKKKHTKKAKPHGKAVLAAENDKPKASEKLKKKVRFDLPD